MRTKGISLPIETIVIIAVAVLVLVVVTVFFVGGSGKQISSITDSQALATGCVQFSLQYGCNPANVTAVKISGYNATCGGKRGNTLDIACCKFDYTTPESCAQAGCRCST